MKVIAAIAQMQAAAAAPAAALPSVEVVAEKPAYETRVNANSTMQVGPL
jgi:hypothetical protein